ncbi:MAG TPA: four helix bundle protein [Haliangiales bacterium]|nr:four helix bundle protein [Haliangiales bacterium]
MTFDAERVALELIVALRGPLERLEQRNRAHADQTRRAAASIAHNLSEGRRRAARDRTHFWRLSAGSAAELRTALAIASAWGWVPATELAPAHALLDRILAMTWRLVHPRRAAETGRA